MKFLYLDTETFNLESPKVLGTYKYAATCQVMILSYAVDDGPAKVWDRTNLSGAEMPRDLYNALRDPDRVAVAHSSMFDRNVIKHALGWDLPIERWHCTMVQALAHGFPGGLDQLGEILQLPQDVRKLKDGKKLIRRFCGPAPSNHKAERYTSETHPEEWARFVEYARVDIEAMREIKKRLPLWNFKKGEKDLWHLDQRINDRGFAVDRELVAAGARAAVTEKAFLTSRFAELTGGLGAGQRAKFLEWLHQYPQLALTENTQKATFEAIIASGIYLPDAVEEAMKISMMANKTSTAKYAALQPAVSDDGRFRGGLQFDGAARTRRWAGRKYQPQNLPSRGLPPADDIDMYIKALKAGCHDLIFDNLMLYGSAALRGAIIAPTGKKLVCSDLSNIEGRITAWLAGEEWKLEAFRAFDAGEGPDLYNVTAGQILGIDPYKVPKSKRNVFGKVPELALGFGGGVGALQQFAKGYGVNMLDYWDSIKGSLDRKFVEQAFQNFEYWGKKSGMDRIEWAASETIKLAWRDRHPATVKLWKDCEAAAKRAISCPGHVVPVGPHLKFKVVAFSGFKYLVIRLPSGQFLCYFSPRLDEGNRILYEALDTDNGKRIWRTMDTFGGKFVENQAQSIARDVMASNMPTAEGAGYETILTIHDELLTEAPDTDAFSADGLGEYLAAVPDWAPGLPLAAGGFEAFRYRKD